MSALPLRFRDGHVFVELEGERWLLGTGARISYVQDDSVHEFPCAGNVTDLYPGAGQLQTDTHDVPC